MDLRDQVLEGAGRLPSADASSTRCPMSVLSAQERADVAGVGFMRGGLSRQTLTRPRSSLHSVRGPGHLSRIEPTYLVADTAGMAKKPEPAQPIRWDIYRAAAKGNSSAPSRLPTRMRQLRRAAAEYKTQLIAVRR